MNQRFWLLVLSTLALGMSFGVWQQSVVAGGIYELRL